MQISPVTGRAASRRRLVLVLGLLLASSLVVGGIALRVLTHRNLELTNLVWNLFLAWVPFVFALAFYDGARNGTRSRSLVALGGVWLVFLPNAPYLVTDVKILDHLVGRIEWYDVVLAIGSATLGLVLGFISLYLVQAVVSARLGRGAGWLLATGALGLSGLGVYLGRYQRWNSWEVLTEPSKIFGGLGAGLLDPLAHARPLAVSMFFAVACFGGYAVFYAVFQPQLRRLEER